MAKRKTPSPPPGQLHDKLEIKFFILYVLKALGGHAPIEAIHEVSLLTESANYFDYMIYYTELVEREMILELEYKGVMEAALSAAGDFTLEQFKNRVSNSTRHRVDRAILEYHSRIQRERDIQAIIEEVDEKSFDLFLIINDEGVEIFKLKINLPTYDMCKDIADRFKKKPAPIYKNLLMSMSDYLSSEYDDV